MAATLVTGLPSAHAGWVEGPYVVWVNLPKTQAVDARIKAFVDADREQCWSDGALLYMRKRPEGVTDELARQAVVEFPRLVKKKELLSNLEENYD